MLIRQLVFLLIGNQGKQVIELKAVDTTTPPPFGTGMVTNLIKLKFVFELEAGKLKLYTRGRGKKALIKAQEQILDQLADATRVEAAGISYVGEPSVAKAPEKLLQQVVPQVTPLVARTGPIIATHTGVGAYALMFYTVD